MKPPNFRLGVSTLAFGVFFSKQNVVSHLRNQMHQGLDFVVILCYYLIITRYNKYQQNTINYSNYDYLLLL